DLGRRLQRVDLEVECLVGPADRCRGSRSSGRHRDTLTRRLARRITRVLWVELIAQSCGLLPHLTVTAGGLLQIARQRIESRQILALGVDLEQLEINLEATRLGLNG